MGLGGISIFELGIAIFLIYLISIFLVFLSDKVSGVEQFKWSVIVFLFPFIGFVLFRISVKKRS
jgi:hypothetical protein